MDVITEKYFYLLLKTSFLVSNKNIYWIEYFYSLIFLNIVIYIVLLIFFFSIFFLFDFKVFRNLSEYKFFKSTSYLNSTLIVVFFSLAGVPPFLGFFTKFFLFSSIFSASNFFFFFLFIFLNLFTLFFYIQNTRFLISKSYKNIFLFFFYKSYINIGLIKLLVFFNYINIFALIFFEYILIYIYQFIFYINIY